MKKVSPEPVRVEILDREYQFACEPEERDALKAAATYLDERMRSVRDGGSLMALERIAVMTAMNLSDEILKMKQNEAHRQERVDSRIRMLADELDDALNSHLG
jgi:cell division protein ZapA